MNSLDIVILGPEGTQRAAIEETARRLGHSAVGLDPATVAGLPPSHGDVLVVDLRDDDSGCAKIATELVDDERPLIIVANQPRRLVRTLSKRSSGTLLLTGSEDDRGFRVALTVCSGLSVIPRPVTRRRTVSRGLGALRAAAVY